MSSHPKSAGTREDRIFNVRCRVAIEMFTRRVEITPAQLPVSIEIAFKNFSFGKFWRPIAMLPVPGQASSRSSMAALLGRIDADGCAADLDAIAGPEFLKAVGTVG